MFQKIIVEQAWYYLVLCVVAALAAALFLYYKHKKSAEVPKVALFSLALLRFAAVLILSFLLLSIFVRRISTKTEQPIILLAVDNSTSMLALPDSAAPLKDAIEKLRAALSEKYEVKTLLFGNSVRTAGAPDFSDKETDINQVLKETELNYANQAVGALVLISDGISNKGANPIYAGDKMPFSIYTLGCGDTIEKKDIVIQKINHNDVVYAGNQFPVEVQINANQCKGQTAKLSLKQNGNLLQSKSISIAQDRFSELVTFTLQADKPGLQRYEFDITSDAKEQELKNNRGSIVIEVIDNQQKITLVANAPHPDIAALREALTGFGNYDLDYFLMPEKPLSLKGSNLLLIHGYNASLNDLLQQCKAENVPYLLVQPQTFEGLQTLSISSSIPRNQEVEPILKPEFNAFTISNELQNFLQSAPAVKCPLGRYRSLTGNQALLNQRIGSVETEYPIFYFNETAGLKSAVFVGDGLWKWAMNDFAQHGNKNVFNELISKTVQYLSVKSDKSFFRLRAARIISESNNVEMDAEVYNKSYQLITEPEVGLEVLDKAGKKFNYTFSKNNSTYKLDLGRLAPGDYKYKGFVTYNGEKLVKEGSFAVKELNVEQSGESANHSLLRQMSARSGGQFFKEDAMQQLQSELLNNDNIKPITYTQSTVSPLSDITWLFFVILAVLSIEWFLRKRYFGI